MKETIIRYRWWILAVVVIIIFSSVKSCTDRQQQRLSGENKVLKDQVRVLKDGVAIFDKNRLKERDSILNLNTEKERKIGELYVSIEDKNKKILSLEEKGRKEKRRVISLGYIDIAKELNQVYNTTNAKATYISVNLEKDLGNRVLETIIDSEVCQDVVSEKNIQLQSKDSIITIKNSQIKNNNILLVSAEKQIDKQKELDKAQDKFNEGQGKEIKKLKQKNLFNKILTPLALGAGIYFGTLITK